MENSKSWYEPAWRQRHRMKQGPSRAPNVLNMNSVWVFLCSRAQNMTLTPRGASARHEPLLKPLVYLFQHARTRSWQRHMECMVWTRTKPVTARMGGIGANPTVIRPQRHPQTPPFATRGIAVYTMAYATTLTSSDPALHRTTVSIEGYLRWAGRSLNRVIGGGVCVTSLQVQCKERHWYTTF